MCAVAAAIAAGASIIITANIRDFPESLLDELGLSVLTLDELLLQLLTKDPGKMRTVILRSPRRCVIEPGLQTTSSSLCDSVVLRNSPLRCHRS